MVDSVVNRSSKPLSDAQVRVLARGFKFRPSTQSLPTEDIIIATESLVKSSKMTAGKAACVRTTVAVELKRMETL